MFFDVILIGDFRFRGGTSTSISQEIRTLHGAGYSVALIQKRATLLKKHDSFHPAIQASIEAGQATLLTPGEVGKSACKLATLHNPFSFVDWDPNLPRISADKAILVAHHPIVDALGRPYYDAATVHKVATRLAGEVTWAPISPLCRQNMNDAALPFRILPDDWTNEIFAEDWASPRTRWAGPRPVIGRHSRPESEKWPGTREEVLEVYPRTKEFDVKLLGAEAFLKTLVGRPLPRNWEIFEFDQIDPREFLRRIDFFVYFHRHDWVEAFGRTIAEAAASGAVVILPEYMRINFGNAALYRDPPEVLDTVRELRADRQAYAAQSRLGRKLIDQRYGPHRFLQRIQGLIGDPDRASAPARSLALQRGRAAAKVRARERPATDFDVVHLGDLSGHGEAAWRVANEARIEAEAGYRIGLLHVPARGMPSSPIYSPIHDLVRTRLAIPIQPATAVTTKLLLIHDPKIVGAVGRAGSPLPKVAAEQAIAFCDPSSSQRRWTANDTILRHAFGPRLRWAATTATQRDAMRKAKHVRALREIWSPAVAFEKFSANAAVQPMPVLGAIWTGDADIDSLLAYRMSQHFGGTQDDATVRLMDAPTIEGARNYPWPENFQLCSSNNYLPWKFLRSLDFLIALPCRRRDRPPIDLIASALGMGVPVIVGTEFRDLLGDGAVYGKPSEILRLATEIHQDAARMKEAKSNAKRFAKNVFSPAKHLARVEQFVGAPKPVVRKNARAVTEKRRVVFISSNGVGLGHLTRLLAIARRMPADIEPIFVTMSPAISIVEQAGYPVEYLPFHVYANCPPEDWNGWLAQELGQIFDFHQPSSLVFDGTTPYGGLVSAFGTRREMSAVWVRRAMWRETQNTQPALGQRQFFDLVIEPADIAESLDRGATTHIRSTAFKVPPIRLLDVEELHSRETAAERLGLDPTRPAVLIQLGSGWSRDLTSLVDDILAALADRKRVQPVLAEWLISEVDLNLWPGVPRLRGYPLAKYFNAFDFTISAAGYNSYTDAITLGLPAILVANEHPMMDDQTARASYAADAGAAFKLDATKIGEIGPLIDALLHEDVRFVMRTNCLRLAQRNGAAEAAAAIAALARRQGRS